MSTPIVSGTSPNDLHCIFMFSFAKEFGVKGSWAIIRATTVLWSGKEFFLSYDLRKIKEIFYSKFVLAPCSLSTTLVFFSYFHFLSKLISLLLFSNTHRLRISPETHCSSRRCLTTALRKTVNWVLNEMTCYTSRTPCITVCRACGRPGYWTNTVLRCSVEQWLVKTSKSPLDWVLCLGVNIEW